MQERRTQLNNFILTLLFIFSNSLYLLNQFVYNKQASGPDFENPHEISFYYAVEVPLTYYIYLQNKNENSLRHNVVDQNIERWEKIC